jgi:hypothetical protein
MKWANPDRTFLAITMPKDIFISYSRRDQEFFTRLASDLDSQVAGLWFDRSAIQPGRKWQCQQ